MMIERIIPWVKGKKVLILGFGREGKSTWNVLQKLDRRNGLSEMFK